MNEDHHYAQFRADHARQLDADYAAWQQHRVATQAGPSGKPSDPDEGEVAPEHEGALAGLGRAIGEAVTGTREPDLRDVDIRKVDDEDDDADKAPTH